MTSTYGTAQDFAVGPAESRRYKRLDVLRVYGFNLILLPVNLSGSFASILQLLTGEKSAFKRTPKVRNRTIAATTYLLAPIALIALCAYTVVRDVQLRQWDDLVFAGLNLVLATYAMVAFVGVGNTVVDLVTQPRSSSFEEFTFFTVFQPTSTRR
ncbi:hypothetical protein [Actinoplanes auranticolor]|uniref:Uncharacterized protein n=1 Tax=Actinoplanes auranticolor TaxID=47988 RepID=A0A919S8P8_9ACTN|nr:hypothetical protein [Actinoplanes auranticolor]GIM67172.1 hypothetical protein Aau02nite_26230 [Actinoplanes auranticolor]